MAAVRHLLFVAALRGFTLEVRFVGTADNGPADALSRGDLQRFRRLRPETHEEPDDLPAGATAYMRTPDAGPGPLTGVTV